MLQDRNECQLSFNLGWARGAEEAGPGGPKDEMRKQLVERRGKIG